VTFLQVEFQCDGLPFSGGRGHRPLLVHRGPSQRDREVGGGDRPCRQGGGIQFVGCGNINSSQVRKRPPGSAGPIACSPMAAEVSSVASSEVIPSSDVEGPGGPIPEVVDEFCDFEDGSSIDDAAALSRYEDFGPVSDDSDASALDGTAVDEMLKKSVKTSTLAKYSRLWDKWACFASSHEVDVMPPDMRALEIFIVDTADLAGSAGVANLAAAAVTHFTTLEGYLSIPVHRSTVFQAVEGDQAHAREGGPSQETLHEGAYRRVYEGRQSGVFA
jgi:hypothetical protein